MANRKEGRRISGGRVSITEQVIASIAGIAASEVEGCHHLKGSVADDIATILGNDRKSKGVETALQDESVRISLKVAIQYGYPIHEVAKQIQAKVKAEVEEMTGLTVSGVDVYVQELQSPGKEVAERRFERI